MFSVALCSQWLSEALCSQWLSKALRSQWLSKALCSQWLCVLSGSVRLCVLSGSVRLCVLSGSVRLCVQWLLHCLWQMELQREKNRVVELTNETKKVKALQKVRGFVGHALKCR